MTSVRLILKQFYTGQLTRNNNIVCSKHAGFKYDCVIRVPHYNRNQNFHNQENISRKCFLVRLNFTEAGSSLFILLVSQAPVCGFTSFVYHGCLSVVKQVTRLANFQVFKVILMKYSTSIYVTFYESLLYTLFSKQEFSIWNRKYSSAFPQTCKCLYLLVATTKHTPNSKMVADEKKIK